MLALSVTDHIFTILGFVSAAVAIAAFTFAVVMLKDPEDRSWSWPYALGEVFIGGMALLMAAVFFEW